MSENKDSTRYDTGGTEGPLAPDEVVEIESTLLPCPFDGGKAELRNTWTAAYWIECTSCGAEAHGDPARSAESGAHRDHLMAAGSAVGRWNRRKS